MNSRTHELARFSVYINAAGKVEFSITGTSVYHLRSVLKDAAPEYVHTESLLEQLDYVQQAMKELGESIIKRYGEDRK